MSTTMEYLNCSVDEGLVSKMLTTLGFAKSESGRWPSGLKVDTLREIVAVLDGDLKLVDNLGAAIKSRRIHGQVALHRVSLAHLIVCCVRLSPATSMPMS